MNNQNTPGGRQGISNNQGQFLKRPKPIGDTKSVQRDANDTYGQWRCPNDETINTGEYCVICGSRNPKTVEKKIVCSTCGYQNGKAATFCAGCGRNLSQPTGPETQKKSIPAGLTIGLIVGGCGILMAVCLICVLLLGKASDLPPETTPPPSQTPAHTHSWAAATCTDPKTCRTCGATSGSAKGHQWQPATTTSPERCSRCGTTRGDVLTAPNPFSSLHVGDLFVFGEYCNEAIIWEVLDEEDGRILVMSLYGLECIQYDDQGSYDTHPEAVSWNDCSLRAWLNGEFYRDAFVSNERSFILADEDLGDKVFILSETQVRNYMSTAEQRECDVTEHAAANHAYGWWWLRTDSAVTKTAIVNSDGKLKNTRVNAINGTVRPVIWISTE